MKTNKITLVAQTIGMYIMELPLYIWFIVELIPLNNESLANGLIKATLILTALVLPICIANIVLSVISVFKGESDVSKTVMKVKLALIPWFILNFAMCVIIIALMLNPFMMIGIPIVIAFLVVGTYFCMITTSLPDVAYYLRNVLIKKAEKLSPLRVAVVVCLFFFCLDVIGSVLFYNQNKKLATPSK